MRGIGVTSGKFTGAVLLRLVGAGALASVSLALTPAFDAPAAAAQVSYSVTATIPVGQQPTGVAVAAALHRVYVPNFVDRTLSVIDSATNAVIGTVPLTYQPTAVAVDTVSTPLVAKATTTARPAVLIQPPVGSTQTTVFISSYNDEKVMVMDAATDILGAPVSLTLNNYIKGMDVDTSSHLLYVAGEEGASFDGTISVIATATHALTKTVYGGDTHYDVAVDSGTHKIYAGSDGLDSVSVLDGATNTIATPISALEADGLAVDSSTHMLYVAGLGNDALTVINESSNTIATTVPMDSGGSSVAVDPTTHTIYVVNELANKVTVVDGTTNKVRTTVDVGSEPTAIAVDPSTHTAFVANGKDNTVSVISRSVVSQVSRLSGSDRFGTAAAVSKAEFPTGGAGAVVLARGDDYPDALVGAPLAAAKNAPLLLTAGASLPSSTKAEIQRVLPANGTVYVLGGASAVPASVTDELTGMGYQVTRYSGATRFATAVQVADALGDPGTVLLATGVNFPDALSAGVAAAKAGGVVLLTAGTSLPAETAGYLSAHATTVYAVGGPAATADPSATPLVGTDRYATSVAVAGAFFSAPTALGVATGVSFPDALSGGGLLGHLGVPLVLVSTSSVPSSAATYVTGVKSTVTKAYLFGGVNTVTQATQDAIDNDLTT